MMLEHNPIDILDVSPELCYLETKSEYRLWGEPVIRPDGSILTITIEQNSRRAEFNIDFTGTSYREEEVLRIGNGNYDEGIARIGQVVYREDPVWGGLKPFADPSL